MKRFDPDLIQVCNQQVRLGARNWAPQPSPPAVLEAVCTAGAGLGQVGLDYGCGDRRWAVLIDEAANLPGLQDLCWPALDHNLRVAAISLATSPLRAWLSDLTGVELELLAVRLGDQTFDDECLVVRLRHSGGAHCDCRLAVRCLGQASWSDCLRGPARSSSGEWSRGGDSTTLRLSLLAHAPALSLGELRTIERGDVIRLQSFDLILGRTCAFAVTVIPAFASALASPPASVRIAVIDRHAPFSEKLPMNPDATPTTIEALELDVQIRLAVLPIDVATLAQIAPGFTFTAPVVLEGAKVAVMVDGQTLGHGHLIQVGDLLGVQVSDWLGRGGLDSPTPGQSLAVDHAAVDHAAAHRLAAA